MHHVLSLFDLSTDEILGVLDRARSLKAELAQGHREPLCPGRVIALLFEKPSLRTRVSFETAVAHLGGTAMYLGADVGWGKRESPEDFARVLGSYVDVIVCRAFQHVRVEELARYSRAAVINGLTDRYHPCQGLADLFTLEEHRGSLEGAKLAYIGDANNVARSLALACAKLGVAFAIASPDGYELDRPFVEELRQALPRAVLEETADPREAARDADCLYTDVWTSMGQEAEREHRNQAFRDYQVDDRLFALAAPQAVFMHCLPAYRGLEVTADVMDGHRSVVYQQAENRMHVQKGLLACLLAP